MHTSDRQLLTAAKRVVVKVGTAVVARRDGGLALGRLGALAEQIHELRQSGREVILVSSGAVGLGVERLGFDRRPTSQIDVQACAAAGQGVLMGLYEHLFARLGHRVAQVLLTEADFRNRTRHVSLAATLERLLELGAIPVINENDVVSDALGDEARVFQDNDRLAALVASGVGCDAVVLLTDVEGVLTAPPHDPGSVRIPVLLDQEVVIGTTSHLGRGGIGAKIDAGRLAARAGCTAVIASGLVPDVITRVFGGEDVGTVIPAEVGHNRRRRWIAYAAAPEGVLEVDAGAREAMVVRHASLLPIGVREVRGRFEAGSVVSVAFEGAEFARGICALSAEDARGSLGRKGRSKALVHRDDVVILEEA